MSVFAASLIRGNRSNCALFCDNLDWLVSKLDRLEASSGICKTFFNKWHKMNTTCFDVLQHLALYVFLL